MRRALLPLSIALFGFSMSANAQDYKTVLDIPAGHTLVTLSATEQVEIDQDLLVGSLQYVEENKDPKKLQDDINEKMAKALELAKNYDEVKTSTEQYYVYQRDQSPQPVDGDETKHKPDMTWHGEQGLQIKSKKSDDLLKLAGELQALGLIMQGLDYTVSPELLESTQESLLEGAITKLKSKAERTAKALGKSSADLLQVNVDMNNNNDYARPMMAMANEGYGAKMAAPVAQAGQSEVSMTVSAQAMLNP